MLVFLSYIIRQSGKFTFSLLRLLFNCSVYGNMFRIFTTQNGIIGRMSKKGGYKGQAERISSQIFFILSFKRKYRFLGCSFGIQDRETFLRDGGNWTR